MMRNALILATSVLILGTLGCGGGGSSVSRRKKMNAAEKRYRPGNEVIVGGIDFNRYWPREEVVKLSAEDKAKLQELALTGMKGNNWEHCRDVLVALGEHAMPALINQVDSKQPTAAAADPIPVVVGSKVKSLGQLSHDVLLEIVQYHSKYKGKLPVRTKVAWQAWWEANKAGLEIR